MHRLVKFAEFGYHIVYGFCCYCCHVDIIIKVGFIGDVLRYMFEFSTYCFNICSCVSILSLHHLHVLSVYLFL